MGELNKQLVVKTDPRRKAPLWKVVADVEGEYSDVEPKVQKPAPPEPPIALQNCAVVTGGAATPETS
jgi:hypothetical protein